MLRLTPRETRFFELFAEMAQTLTAGARQLLDLLQNYTDVATAVQKIKGIEHRGDEIAHAVYIKLNSTFITPFDREDIHTLASSLDDVLDFINAAATRLDTYKITKPPSEAVELATIIFRQAEEISKALALLEKGDALLEYCVEVNRLENDADGITRAAIGRLFEAEHDPIQLIKHNVLETVVLKSA
jgi:predicted phosphate transport protein (TIGR00153 family)